MGIAFGVTAISTGLSNATAKKAALTMAGLAVVWYYPAQWIFNNFGSYFTIFILISLIVLSGLGLSRVYSKIDRGPIARTAIITGILSGFLILADRIMQSWSSYLVTDAVNASGSVIVALVVVVHPLISLKVIGFCVFIVCTEPSYA